MPCWTPTSAGSGRPGSGRGGRRGSCAASRAVRGHRHSRTWGGRPATNSSWNPSRRRPYWRRRARRALLIVLSSRSGPRVARTRSPTGRPTVLNRRLPVGWSSREGTSRCANLGRPTRWLGFGRGGHHLLYNRRSRRRGAPGPTGSAAARRRTASAAADLIAHSAQFRTLAAVGNLKCYLYQTTCMEWRRRRGERRPNIRAAPRGGSA